MHDTIVAIATGAARGGVGVVRLSGPRAGAIGEKIFHPSRSEASPWTSHKLFHGFVTTGEGRRIDEGYGVRFAAPNSYTGEEVVEIQIHGSPHTLQETVELAKGAGARLAEPGEFSKRAFLSGKIDLVQAEAIAELINAESVSECESARRRSDGNLSKLLDKLRGETISLLAECEADVDFPEEGLSLTSRPHVIQKFKEIRKVGAELLESYTTNQRIFGGFSVALVGAPNVGKSSLFNALLRDDRAIVSATAGTTRDVLREELLLAGQRVRLMDTAGVREAVSSEIEEEGVARSKKQAKGADLVFWVREPDGAEDVEIERAFVGKPVWVVWNKCDVKKHGAGGEKLRTLSVSARTGEGVAELRSALTAHVSEQVRVPRDGGVSNDRQRELLIAFLEALDRAERTAGEGGSPELVAFELRGAHRAISRILGKDEGVEEILGEIFSRFCIGK